MKPKFAIEKSRNLTKSLEPGSEPGSNMMLKYHQTGSRTVDL